ncbi:BTB/POZ protein [Chaetomium fimeti]|uniref:BTB/POZ protein n=1 Tax=Chaetomium fimeti TaxID=1854472 RepID=A0AAE0H8I0_9PEZI|nr:BTB/POZ protein [Chaetomium fimeti]
MALMSPQPNDELLSSLDNLFGDKAYSDLTVTCRGDEYKVHKAIICPRSPFFASACNGPFQEARTGIIDLPDDDPQAVKLMIRYFYYLDYPQQPEAQDKGPGTPNKVSTKTNFPMPAMAAGAKKSGPKKKVGYSPQPNLTVHARVYALAEKYDIKGLKTLSLGKFEIEADLHWDSDDFMCAVEEVYTSTVDEDRGMRDAVVEAVYNNAGVLEKESMQNLVKRLPLCFDLMMRFRGWL